MQVLLYDCVRETLAQEGDMGTDDPKSRYGDAACEYLSRREWLLYGHIGRRLPRGFKVLDVGSGAGSTAAALLRGAGIGDAAKYTSIDWRIDPMPHMRRVADRVLEWMHVRADALALDMDDPEAAYDVVIIDVEPHGREVQVYDRICRTLAPVHLCVLKHVGSLDAFGCALADRFIQHQLDRHRVVDFYAEAGRETRDVWVVMARHDVARVVGSTSAQSLAVGERASYVDPTAPRHLLQNRALPTRTV